MLEVKKSKEELCVGGIIYDTYEELSKAHGLDVDRLYHAHQKYGYIEFAVDYVARNQNKNSLMHYDGTYRIDGETFMNFEQVAKYLNVSYGTLKKYSYGCTTWECVRKKLARGYKRNVGYTVDNVYYSSIKKVADALDLDHSKLSTWHNRLGDMNRAIDKVRLLERRGKLGDRRGW